ncbi:hypothetical protein STCU_11361 [Strigomonas culicis]|uniref:Uncharacterized protein n=1 Tax=Strigomonas culicis TaxID=28005 RepID=S9UNV0_9TRYP|nr:hypothetical protein STCU_11361 [Strigomonas culicis]|eukprot:EPY16361.1 hypothetical protein STCU_11361 [Strigomonas culicis]
MNSNIIITMRGKDKKNSIISFFFYLTFLYYFKDVRVYIEDIKMGKEDGDIDSHVYTYSATHCNTLIKERDEERGEYSGTKNYQKLQQKKKCNNKNTFFFL